MRMGPSAGWTTVKADDPSWTHVIDSRGQTWTRTEHEAKPAAGRKRYVRPKLHGEQLPLPE
jgi:hypothetical protein